MRNNWLEWDMIIDQYCCWDRQLINRNPQLLSDTSRHGKMICVWAYWQIESKASVWNRDVFGHTILVLLPKVPTKLNHTILNGKSFRLLLVLFISALRKGRYFLPGLPSPCPMVSFITPSGNWDTKALMQRDDIVQVSRAYLAHVVAVASRGIEECSSDTSLEP
ncbi:hypothetical protein V6N13_040051 [Hibiscus sabdariffa]